MPDEQLKSYIAQLQEIENEILDAFKDMQREELRYAADNPRSYTVRRNLLSFTDHIQEHISQIEAARTSIGANPTMPQRMLARLARAYGDLRAGLLGLDDADLDRVPEPGEWTIRQVLEHVIGGQQRAATRVCQARERKQVSEKE
jgi:hypothetical protein